jgi:membrane associated rhomboid family serine protease
MCHGTFFDAHAIVPAWGKGADPRHWVEQRFAEWRGRTGLLCPHDGEAMDAYRLTWDESDPVELDVCPGCSGLWLDEGEGALLKDVLDEHASERAEAERWEWKGYLFHVLLGIKTFALPMEVYHPTRRRPWLLYMLITSIVLAFLWSTWVVSSFGEAGTALVDQYKLVPARITEGEQVWGLVTRGWLHSGWAHLLGNMYFLFVFGDNIEDRAGRRGFALLYGVALLASAFAYWVVDMHSTTSVLGASGAVSGVTGAYFVLFPRVRLWVSLFIVRVKVPAAGFFLTWLALNVVGLASGAGGVAWESHLGGFATGVIVGALWRRRLVTRRSRVA